MRRNLLLLLRISRSEYNTKLWRDYTLYMNSQVYFKKHGLEGQFDANEGMVANGPAYLRYSIDEGENWRELGEVQSISRNCNAYIFCMYGVFFDREKYNPIKNEYIHDIPWECISELFVENDTELILLKNTSVFLDKFNQAAQRTGLNSFYAPVRYDLGEKLLDENYFGDVVKDPVQVLFHKMRKFEEQNEVRLAIICPDKPDHYELQLEHDNSLIFERFKIRKGASIRIVLKNLELNYSGEPMKFSSDVELYEGILS